MKNSLFIVLLLMSAFIFQTQAQAQTQSQAQKTKENTLYLSNLQIKKGKKQVFDEPFKDSILYVEIDTLQMADKSSLQFYGFKEVHLQVNHAVLGKNTYISGIFKENHASDFNLKFHLHKLGSLYVIAQGKDANNGFRTFANGDGGDVVFLYSQSGIIPQTQKRKDRNFLGIQNEGGGKAINPNAEVGRILSQIGTSGARMGGLPQGQVYSGSAGLDGKTRIEAY